MKNETERNTFTGIQQDKPSGDILNPLTGQYRRAEESDDKDDVEKNENETKWPSISNAESD